MRKSVPFQIAGKLQCKATANGFKQVQIGYLAVISYLHNLVQPSYTLYANQPFGTAQGLLGNACHFDLRLL